MSSTMRGGKIKRALIALTLTTMAFAAVVSVPDAAHAASSGAIVGAGSGRCIDVSGSNATDGVQLQIWDCNGQTNQQFTLTSDGELQVLGKCLDASGQGKTNGTQVILWSCAGSTNQQWTVSGSTIKGVDSGLCLDATGQGTANGTLLQLWACNGQSNQSWTAPGASGGGTTTTPPSTGSTGGSSTPGKGTFTNPIAGAPYGADPWMGYYNGYYYYAGTAWNSQLVIKRATSVAGLASAPDKVVFTGSGTDNCCNTWAPDLKLLNGPDGMRWYYYYTAGTAACCGAQRSYVLESSGTDPMGPYTFKGQLRTLANNAWSIDGSVLTLNGADYFMFSAFGGDGKQDLFIAPMSNPWTISGYGSQISTPTYGWETVGNPVNEAPFALQHGGKTFITYSASACATSSYAVGMLTYNGGSPTSASSWVKKSTPILSTNSGTGVYAPGGQGFFSSPDGSETWMVYHANENSGEGCGPTRVSRIQKISWNSDGTPNVGTPPALTANLATPAGDPGGSTTFPVVGTKYRITNGNSGQVLDAVNCGTGNGTKVDQWSSLGNACQQWTFAKTSSGYYTIKNVNSGTLLDSVNCGAGNGTAVDLWSALGNPCQEWNVQPIGNQYIIANRGNGLVLDLTNCSTSSGAAIDEWTALGNTCQQWNIAP